MAEISLKASPPQETPYFLVELAFHSSCRRWLPHCGDDVKRCP